MLYAVAQLTSAACLWIRIEGTVLDINTAIVFSECFFETIGSSRRHRGGPGRNFTAVAKFTTETPQITSWMHMDRSTTVEP